MGWGHVIQDSDEDEPLGEDIELEAAAPTDAVKGGSHAQDYAQGGSNESTTDQQAYYPIERTAGRDTHVEPEISINFDQFLQSQETTHSAPTLSQQRREERWIPSATEGGGGSIGAMLTEIGHAQRRLVEDEASNGDLLLPSTISGVASEISQPGSYPMMESYDAQQQWRENEIHEQTHCQPPMDNSCVLTQPLEQPPVQGYEYRTLVETGNVNSPSAGRNGQAMNAAISIPLDNGHLPTTTVQRSRSWQPQIWSPHDTQPISSVASPGVGRSKSDNFKSSLMSPQSDHSAHDELALPLATPVIAIDNSAVKRKRGRPKKQPVPDEDDDEEDELAAAAAPRNFFTSKVNMNGDRRRPETSPYGTTVVAQPDVEINDEVKDQPEPTSGLMVVLPVTFDENSNERTAAGIPSEPTSTDTRPSKQEKSKQSRTASEPLNKITNANEDNDDNGDDDDNDDVICVDSRPIPLDRDAIKEQTPNSSVQIHANDTPSITDDPSSPKKRGRKRKQTAIESTSTPASKKQQQAHTAPAPNTATSSVEMQTSDSASHHETKPPTIPNQPSDNPNPQHQDLNQSAQKKESAPTNDIGPNTPQRTTSKESDSSTIRTPAMGLARHSPILSTTKVPYRVGLSKRARIAPLLKVVRK
ncbi:hypothetical protein N7539_003508 [Penicillium diatomitis]|uniref:Uncharacterized protein n=1 Tax=Penicillium diatomitis TaxID=2819901 RepID=A0A9W9XD10_9EURO|nr:uncharacterized protein N7539_003508 [Penicillium diatomitis]KAJ5488618.1 hypothetical protein N7539_003508 [Penicillium diatomitis]